MTESLLCRVTPFGNPGIKGCLLLPLAFRSLPRPSSPDSSKASSVDPYSLDHITVCSVSISVAFGRFRPHTPLSSTQERKSRQSRFFVPVSYLTVTTIPETPISGKLLPFFAYRYVPVYLSKDHGCRSFRAGRRRNHSRLLIVEVKGLEPLTPRMQI